MFRSYLPRLEMQVLAAVGHDPILEKPDAVNAALSSFLDRHFSGWKRQP
jgi:pimeloyl-ACP methyl ester carboxylesterase